MNERLAALVDRFAALRVLVIGDAMLDCFIEGTTNRFCPEAPAPVVAVSDRWDLPGGAANVAVNVRALGAGVTLLSVIGMDSKGTALRRALHERDVGDGSLLAADARRTLTKERVVVGSQTLLRLDRGSADTITGAAEASLLHRLPRLHREADAVIVSDYGYGVMTPRVIDMLADLQARQTRVLIVDSRHTAKFRALAPTAVKPNYQEALALLNIRHDGDARNRAETLRVHGDTLFERTGAQIVAVTLDSDGAVTFERGRPPYRTYAQNVRGPSVAGAGDTYTATLAVALAAQTDTASAAELAAAASAIVVAKERTATCSAQELRHFLAPEGKFVADWQVAQARLESYRRQGRRVVLTNGCFDILHPGHVSYLHRARTLGDLLVVGVNSDDSIRRLKGPGRPINTLEDRLQVLAALSCVDLLLAFHDDTPICLVRVVRPDIFVKGGDYTIDRLPEAPVVAELGGVVHILPYIANRSTTGLIEQIREGNVTRNGRSLQAVGSGTR